MVIVKVSNGRLCGGYCSIGWKSSGGWQHDNNSFVFSLDSLKKYNGSNQGHSGHICWRNDLGPYFGDDGSLGFTSPFNQENSGYGRVKRKSLIVPGDSEG